jgi:hypothetical protein
MIYRVKWSEPVIGKDKSDMPPGKVQFAYRPMHQDFETADEAGEFRREKREEGHRGRIEILALDDRNLPDVNQQPQDEHEGTWEG